MRWLFSGSIAYLNAHYLSQGQQQKFLLNPVDHLRQNSMCLLLYGSIAVQTTHLILNCSSFLSSFWLHTGQRIVTFALNSIWTECVLFTVTHLCCMCVLCIKPDNNTKDTFRKNKNTKLKESLLCVQSQMTKCDLYVLQVRAQRTCVCRTHFVEVGTLHLIRTQGFDVHH